MTNDALPTYLTPGYPQSLIMLRMRDQPDAIRDELWEVLTRADKAARDAWEREGGVVARALLDEYFPGDYEAWMCNADSSPMALNDEGETFLAEYDPDHVPDRFATDAEYQTWLAARPVPPDGFPPFVPPDDFPPF